MRCVPFAVGGVTHVPTGGRVVCRFIDAFLTCCRVDGGRHRPGGRLLVRPRRRGTAGRPARRTVPTPHESRFFASTNRYKRGKNTHTQTRWRPAGADDDARISKRQKPRRGGTVEHNTQTVPEMCTAVLRAHPAIHYGRVAQNVKIKNKTNFRISNVTRT